jgi:hypothetical protein
MEVVAVMVATPLVARFLLLKALNLPCRHHK